MGIFGKPLLILSGLGIPVCAVGAIYLPKIVKKSEPKIVKTGWCSISGKKSKVSTGEDKNSSNFPEYLKNSLKKYFTPPSSSNKTWSEIKQLSVVLWEGIKETECRFE